MNLHRTKKQPDWELIKPADRSSIQKVAAATNGYLTPPNVITIIGLGLVLYGIYALLNQDFLIAFTALLIGRALDILDGYVADKTGTKSPLGELFDAAVDKIGTLLTIAAFFLAAVAPWWVVVLVLLPQVIIPLVIFYKRTKKIHVHPTRAGKLSMALTWVGLLELIAVRALDFSWPHIIVITVYAIVFASTILGFYALWQYSTGKDQD